MNQTFLNTICFQIHLFTEDSNVVIHLSINSFTQTKILQPTLFIPHQLKRYPEWYSRLLLMFLIKFSKSCRTSFSYMKTLFQSNFTWRHIITVLQVVLWEHECPQKLMVHHHRFFKSWINIFAATLTALFSWMQLQLDQLLYTNR